MLPYPLEDFLQVSLHSLFRGMVDLGKFLYGSLLAADTEILPEYQVLVRCQDAVKQGIDLLGDLKTGRTVEGMMVIAVILDAVLRSEVLPLVLVLHVGVLLVKEFPVDVHLLAFSELKSVLFLDVVILNLEGYISCRFLLSALVLRLFHVSPCIFLFHVCHS